MGIFVVMKMLHIEWYDSQMGQSRWQDISEYKAEMPVMKSMGRVIEDTDTHITLCPHIGEETETAAYQGYGILSIPKCCIKIMKEMSISS